VRVFEQKREEEAAPESQSAFAAYRAEDHVPLAPALLALALLAALAGATLTLGRRQRDPHRHRHRTAALATARGERRPAVRRRPRHRPGGPR
jgi:hypothetical protein